jgi:nucleotide-binding universal stress UspA family protein
MKILVAVDGSKASLNAVKCLIDHAGWYREKPQVELVTVHLPVPQLPGMGAAVGKSQIERYYQEEGESRVAPARKLLDAAGLRYELRILVGHPAEQIVKHAAKAGCDLIYIGAPQAMIGSTTTRVAHTSEVPVLLVK